MSESSTTLHEDPKTLSVESVDRHRAIVSLMEELEATDWYDQRFQASSDKELRSILAHNRDEEKEHAAMLIEWLRRNDKKMAENLKKYLFTSGPIHDEKDAGGGAKAAPAAKADRSLGIGSLRVQEKA